jgi:chromosome segregation ATPase
MQPSTETAEQRFRKAFERLKSGKPEILPKGTPVSQNNVAKEAGTDPTALRKTRYPALIREIQAWLEFSGREKEQQKKRKERQRRAREDLKARVKTLECQRDHAQSELLSAHRQILELLTKNAKLQRTLDDLLPPVTPLRK